MKGFTLLELLISLIVLSTVMAILYGAYGSSVDTVQAARDQGEMRQEARMILERMSMELQSATAANGRSFQGEHEEINGRRADRMAFDTFCGRGEYAAADLFRVSYRLAGNPEEKGLTLTSLEEGVVSESVSIGSRSDELAATVAALEITYQDAEGRKFDRWNGGEGGDGLPSFIFIRLTMRASSGREQAFATGVHPELAGP